MNIKPPLAPPARRAGTVARLISGILLGGLNVFLLVFALGLYVLPALAPVDSVELYHRTWQKARDHAYDTSKLKDWDKWEHKYDSLIKTDEDAVKYANEMLESTGDHYAQLLPPLAVKAERERSAGAFAGIGVHIEPKLDSTGAAIMAPVEEDGPLMNSDEKGRPLIKEVMPNGPAMQAGMKDGDAIVSIDGQTFNDATMKAVMEKMRGKAGETVEIVVARGKKQVTLKIVRGIVKTEVVSSSMLTADNGTKVGYIRLEHFVERDAADEMAAAITKLDSADRLIIDLRYNPGGDVEVCINLASLFIKDGTIVSMRERTPGSGHNVNTFSVDANNLTVEIKDEATGAVIKQTAKRRPALAGDKKIVILVNGRSASASEMFTGALKDNGRATVVGETTFGKGIGQSVLPMPNGTSLHITSLRYFTPSGKWLGDGGNSAEKHGIEPDHKVKLEQKPGLKLGSPSDNQLSFALQLIAR